MKRLVAATVLAAFGLAPVAALACEYGDQSASVSAEQLGLAAPPQASRTPAATVAKADLPKAAKQAPREVKVTTAAHKVKVASTN